MVALMIFAAAASTVIVKRGESVFLARQVYEKGWSFILADAHMSRLMVMNSWKKLKPQGIQVTYGGKNWYVSESPNQLPHSNQKYMNIQVFLTDGQKKGTPHAKLISYVKRNKE